MITLFIASSWSTLHAAVLVDIRAGGHGEFERVVVELSQRAEFHIEKEGRGLVVSIKDGDEFKDYRRKLPEGALFRVEKIEGNGSWLKIKIALRADVEVKESSMDEPFRIVIDLTKKGKARRTMKKEKLHSLSTKKETSEKPSRDIPPQKAISIDDIPLLPSGMKITSGRDRGVEFNDGWRWIYRKEVQKRLALVEDTAVELEKLVEAELSEEELKELKAALEGMHNAEGLVALKEKYRGTAIAPVVRFVQAYIYERKGFYPEAIAHYRLAAEEIKGEQEKTLLRETLFREGLVMFLQARFADSIEPLKKAYAMGHRRAGGYLANVLLIRGEVAKAWRIFSKLKSPEHSLTIMGIADLSMGAGRYRHARLLYRKLFNRYPDNEEISAFFILRLADTYRLEANRSQSIRLYTNIKDEYKDEARVMGMMGLAEALADKGDKKSLIAAENIYRAIISYDYLATEYAYTAIAEVEARLGRYQRAILYLEEMTQRYPTGEFKYRAYNMRGYIVHRWIDSLFKKNDYHMIARIYRIYEKEIPFGLKAPTYLAAGRAFMELSLYREAIEALKNAVKMGKQDISQEALVLIGFSYMKLDELSRAQRVIEGFLESYPESRLKDRALRVLAMVYHAKGEHKELASIKSKDPDVLLLKASSLYNLRRYSEAERIFDQVAVVYSKTKGKEKKLAHIYITMGDMAFMDGSYRAGIERYIKAKSLSRWLSKEDIAWIDLRLAEGYKKLGHYEAMHSFVEELKDTAGEDGIIEEFVDLLLDEGVERWKETLH